jgi:hypothetical protein
MRLLNKKRKLAQTQEAFDAQADAYLVEYGFPVDDEYRALFGSFIQHSDDKEDTFDPVLMAKRIRKAKATEFAFYLIKPERRPKKEATDVESTEDKAVSKA